MDKKMWNEPDLKNLEIADTQNDLKPGEEEDSLSWQNGFAAWECECS